MCCTGQENILISLVGSEEGNYKRPNKHIREKEMERERVRERDRRKGRRTTDRYTALGELACDK